MEKSGIKWHQGFYGGIELELRDYREYLTFDKEHELSKEPLRMDLLIIRKEGDIRIDNPIARIFRRYNIVEYKSPRDELSIDDLYKTVGYACIYKGMGDKVGAIPVEEMTVSIFRYAYPREMFKAVKAVGASVEKQSPGVYYISGVINIPLQMIVIKELVGGEHTALTVLTRNVKEEEVRRFLSKYESVEDSIDRQNTSAVLEVSTVANEILYESVGGINMTDEMWRILKVDEAIEYAEKRGEERGEKRGGDNILYSLVHDGDLSLSVGARRAGLSEATFTKNMNAMFS